MIKVIRLIEGYGCNLELKFDENGMPVIERIGMVNFRPEHILHSRLNIGELELLGQASSVTHNFDSKVVSDIKYSHRLGKSGEDVRVFYNVVPTAPLRAYLFC